jgi:hypothetical protein
MDIRGLMDQNGRDHRTGPRHPDPVPTGQLDVERILRVRGLARAELTIAILVVLGATLLVFVLAPTFVGVPFGLRDPSVHIVATVAAFAGLLGGLAWMVRIYRRSFGHEDGPPTWRSRLLR